MTEANIQEELMKELGQLPLDRQRQVLDFARTLARERPPASGPVRHFLDLAGTLDPEDADEMLRAVEEDCERIDPDGW